MELKWTHNKHFTILRWISEYRVAVANYCIIVCCYFCWKGFWKSILDEAHLQTPLIAPDVEETFQNVCRGGMGPAAGEKGWQEQTRLDFLNGSAFCSFKDMLIFSQMCLFETSHFDILPMTNVVLPNARGSQNGSHSTGEWCIAMLLAPFSQFAGLISHKMLCDVNPVSQTEEAMQYHCHMG